MSVTIIEALQNAEYNLVENAGVAFTHKMGKDQLHNAIVLLEKGYEPTDLVEPLLEKFGNVDAVPDKD